MGYSHYWTYRPAAISTTRWVGAIKDSDVILATLAPQLQLVVRTEKEWTLVDGPLGATCETFCIPRTVPAMKSHVEARRKELRKVSRMWSADAIAEQAAFDFVKTARRPYDLAVVACLCVLADAGLPVSSDGNPNDWKSGCLAAREILGRSIRCPITTPKPAQ